MIAIGLQGRVRRLETSATEQWQRHRRESVLRLARDAGLTRSVTDAEVDDALRRAEAGCAHVLGPPPWSWPLSQDAVTLLAAEFDVSPERLTTLLGGAWADHRP